MKSPWAWWGASVGAMIAYTAAVLTPFPPLYFFPRLGSWSLVAIAGEPAIRWYGWLAYTGIGSLLGIVIGRFIGGRPPWALVWMIAILSMTTLAWHEQHWFSR